MKVKVTSVDYELNEGELSTSFPQQFEFELPDWLNKMEIESELWDLIPQQTGKDITSVKYEIIEE